MSFLWDVGDVLANKLDPQVINISVRVGVRVREGVSELARVIFLS